MVPQRRGTLVTRTTLSLQLQFVSFDSCDSSLLKSDSVAGQYVTNIVGTYYGHINIVLTWGYSCKTGM